MTPSFVDLDPSFDVHQTSVWSCGGGRQSVAIAGLICLGQINPPDYSVIVNTGREASATWRYAESVLIPELAKVGITLEIASKEKYATVDLWGGADGKALLLPAFTNITGKVGKMTNFCSGEWKRRVLERYMRDVHRAPKWVTWLGMSTDEMRRVRLRDDESGNLREYPLIYGPRPMSTEECLAFITSELGWPEAPKSACWQCPNKTDQQWKYSRDFYPDEFKESCLLDRAIRLIDPHAYLHKSCVPLDEVDFDALCDNALPAEKEGCDSGYCFT